MHGFLTAHGFDPGPTQRPLLTGGISGAVATLPAVGVLAAFGSLEVEAKILGMPVPLTLAAGCAVMALAGVVYGGLFRRGANDRWGGWLFGMAFGFLLWTAGAVMVLPLASGGFAPGGEAAIGVFLSLVVWGAALGGVVPFVHRRLQLREERSRRPRTGPNAAASSRGDVRHSRPEGPRGEDS